MVKESRAVGRPRNFDEKVVIEQAVNTFWKHGGTNTTMRILASEIGLMPASIYNAFGSKEELLHRALDTYLEQVAEHLLTPLEQPGAGPTELVQFIDAVVEWMTDSEHLGCMMLNLLGEQPTGDKTLIGFADLHRTRMRTALRPVLADIDESHADGRANVLLAGIMGISLAARGGAGKNEMTDFANSLQDQIRQWANG